VVSWYPIAACILGFPDVSPTVTYLTLHRCFAQTLDNSLMDDSLPPSLVCIQNDSPHGRFTPAIRLCVVYCNGKPAHPYPSVPHPVNRGAMYPYCNWMPGNHIRCFSPVNGIACVYFMIVIFCGSKVHFHYSGHHLLITKVHPLRSRYLDRIRVKHDLYKNVKKYSNNRLP